MSLEWVDEMPPGATNRPSNARWDWDSIARKLRERPGRWALVARDVPRSHAHAIQKGAKVAFRPGSDWLAYTRRRLDSDAPHGYADLYMAYIGTPGARMRAMEAKRTRSTDGADGG
jgi:hypothetical protein